MDGEFKNNINGFLKDYALWIALAFVAIILITLLLIFVFNKKKKIEVKEEVKIDEDSSKWLKALGGIDNIVDSSARGSRLTINLKDTSIVDDLALKNLGVTSIVKMSDKIILVIENKANDLLEILKK